VGGEGTAGLNEFSSCLKGLFRGQGVLRHRLDTFRPIGQWPTQLVAGPGLASAPFGIPVTIRSGHVASLPGSDPPAAFRGHSRWSPRAAGPNEPPATAAPDHDPLESVI
jgi:hypothetical protein